MRVLIGISLTLCTMIVGIIMDFLTLIITMFFLLAEASIAICLITKGFLDAHRVTDLAKYLIKTMPHGFVSEAEVAKDCHISKGDLVALNSEGRVYSVNGKK